jgi:hypothetical protein
MFRSVRAKIAELMYLTNWSQKKSFGSTVSALSFFFSSVTAARTVFTTPSDIFGSCAV